MARKSKKDSSTPISELGDSAQADGSGSQGPPVIEFSAEAAKAASKKAVVQSAETDDTISLEDDWFAAQEELEEQLGGIEAFTAFMAGGAAAEQSGPQVMATGIGFRFVNGTMSPEVALKVYVDQKLSPSQVGTLAIPASVGGYPTDVEELQDVLPLQREFRRRHPRPVPCGGSCGHVEITAGTIGCLVQLQSGKLCILSNNHVLANSNQASIGDRIIQPGLADGGRKTGLEDRIALLEHFVRLQPSPSVNLVDAAVGWTNFQLVKPKHVTYTLNPTPVSPRLGMTVMKNGRTTGATLGSITAVNVNNIQVPYPGIGQASFRNQIEIRAVGGGFFSRPGDSGSLIVTASSKQPVALLFAGSSDGKTFANNIEDVMSELNILRFIASE